MALHEATSRERIAPGASRLAPCSCANTRASGTPSRSFQTDICGVKRPTQPHRSHHSDDEFLDRVGTSIWPVGIPPMRLRVAVTFWRDSGSDGVLFNGGFLRDTVTSSVDASGLLFGVQFLEAD